MRTWKDSLSVVCHCALKKFCQQGNWVTGPFSLGGVPKASTGPQSRKVLPYLLLYQTHCHACSCSIMSTACDIRPTAGTKNKHNKGRWSHSSPFGQSVFVFSISKEARLVLISRLQWPLQSVCHLLQKAILPCSTLPCKKYSLDPPLPEYAPATNLRLQIPSISEQDLMERYLFYILFQLCFTNP